MVEADELDVLEVQERGLDVVAREQLHRVLMNCTPDVIAALRGALAEGRINGRRYWSVDQRCGCVLGTIVHARGVEDVSGVAMEYRTSTVYALEGWTCPIQPADKPGTDTIGAFRAAKLVQWIDEFE